MAKVNTAEVIANAKFNRFHLGLLLWCCFIILFDGYDLVVYGTVVPVIIKEWALTPIEAGAIGTYGLLGVMLGALFFGPLADRIGRKNVITICIVVFSLFTALCGFAVGPKTFTTFRFIAGLGLGGIMPNVIALMTDYSPKSMRSLTVSIVLCGYSLGGMLAPGLGIEMLPLLGWKSVYWIAALPLITLPFMIKYLPDGANFLLVKGRTKDLRNVLAKVNPQVSISESDTFEPIEVKKTKSSFPVAKLFEGKRGLSTVMLWVTYFMSLLMIYGLNTWLPNLMIKAGYGLGSSLTFLVVLNLGAIIGTLIIGKLADKWGSKRMLVPLYFLGAICLTLLGFKSSTFTLYLLVGITGACTIGAQNIMNAFVSQFYPPFARSTALGVASGIGRVGGMIGPTMGGILLTMTLPTQMNFVAFAIPGIIAAAGFSFVGEKYGYSKNLDKQLAD